MAPSRSSRLTSELLDRAGARCARERSPPPPAGEFRRRWVANQTREALLRFEEKLKASQECVEELPAGAEADVGRLSSSTHGHTPPASPPHASVQLNRSSSHQELLLLPGGTRPPTALGIYDYGCVSLKPRSVFGQCAQTFGESACSPRQLPQRHGLPSGGFHATTLQDPVLMPPRSWAENSPTPVRWQNDQGDVRPLARQEIVALTLRRHASAGPAFPTAVRMNATQEQRARLALRVLDNRREEAVLEQSYFEKGMYEGRFQDPLLEGRGTLPVLVVPDHHEWLRMPPEDMDLNQRMALRIVQGLESYMSRYCGRTLDLFAAENLGPKGVLEPTEFVRGLERLGIASHGELPLARAIKVAAVIDGNFDGRVNIPAVASAIAAWRSLNGGRGTRRGWRPATKEPRPDTGNQRALVSSDSEGTMAGAVRLDMEPKSMFFFRRSADQFWKQQRQLLSRYGEAARPGDVVFGSAVKG